jgi:mannonate dehydratase
MFLTLSERHGDNANVGICVCCGTWLEGGKKLTGKDPDMKALRDVNFDGIVILDHSPAMVGGNYTQTAYGFAYMKALLARANAAA